MRTEQLLTELVPAPVELISLIVSYVGVFCVHGEECETIGTAVVRRRDGLRAVSHRTVQSNDLQRTLDDLCAGVPITWIPQNLRYWYSSCVNKVYTELETFTAPVSEPPFTECPFREWGGPYFLDARGMLTSHQGSKVYLILKPRDEPYTEDEIARAFIYKNSPPQQSSRIISEIESGERFIVVGCAATFYVWRLSQMSI